MMTSSINKMQTSFWGVGTINTLLYARPPHNIFDGNVNWW